MDCYMGVDIGTSGCKAVIFDEFGNQISIAGREYRIITKKQGWAELDTDEVVGKCFQVIEESANQVLPHTVIGIGISSQGEAFTMIDNNGNAMCNAFVSSDIRAEGYAKSWAEEFGYDKLYYTTGHTPHPMFSLFKLLWVKENMPGIWHRAHKILCFEDLLQYHTTVAFSLTGGNILRWFRDEFGYKEIREAEQANIDPYVLLLDKMPVDPTKLLVLPYFTPTGTPYFDPSAKGAIIGLDLSTSRIEIMKALLEGVAYEMKLNLEILEESGYKVNELRVIGGGAKSKAWNQLKADIIGQPVTVLNVTEAGCMGAAMLVKAAFTKDNIVEIAENWVKPVMKLYPEKDKEYAQKFIHYKKLYPTLKNTFF